MARITMRKVQETKLSEVFTLYLASAAARGVKDKTLRTYEQHFNAISKRLDVDGNISLITSKDLDKMILKMREDGFFVLINHTDKNACKAIPLRYITLGIQGPPELIDCIIALNRVVFHGCRDPVLFIILSALCNWIDMI